MQNADGDPGARVPDLGAHKYWHCNGVMVYLMAAGNLPADLVRHEEYPAL